jgi:hypothetical protein
MTPRRIKEGINMYDSEENNDSEEKTSKILLRSQFIC